jgi:hypothetical protein
MRRAILYILLGWVALDALIVLSLAAMAAYRDRQRGEEGDQ